MEASNTELCFCANSKRTKSISGLTLVEVVFSLTIMALVAASVTAGFVFIQRQAVEMAYYTGAQRVLQAHAERIMSIPVADMVSTNYINYNYSGLRITSLGAQSSQSALTNQAAKKFTTYITNSSGNAVSTNITSTEDAVVAYSTIIKVIQTNLTMGTTFNGVSIGKEFRIATITTYWPANGRFSTNNAGQTLSNTLSLSSTVIRPSQ